MFQFPSLPCAPYVFRYASQRITTGGFPHSEIPGSKVGQHLTRAYRSRPRPSSALGAKASTVCPYSLDRKEHVLMSLWSFQGARGQRPPAEKYRQPADGCRSNIVPATDLSKLNSVLAAVLQAERPRASTRSTLSRRAVIPDDRSEPGIDGHDACRS